MCTGRSLLSDCNTYAARHQWIFQSNSLDPSLYFQPQVSRMSDISASHSSANAQASVASVGHTSRSQFRCHAGVRGKGSNREAGFPCPPPVAASASRVPYARQAVPSDSWTALLT